ncbi:hypothetical protein B0A52_00613 [Exophiala mesophila]|uniref:Vacuolar import and degradation protein 27 n=1 Tax=Exophiala mesophila TaxID=212818 RepID=A0A438NHQ2_EXOME|nr:hypothetical protein B0A52_00613 [Exophiala mesophila]
MFMIKNVSKYLFGDSSKQVITEIPQGQLYIVRPLSPKGYSELIYKDAIATIRRTGQEFHYQLVIQRAYEEGEDELAEDDDEQGVDGLDKDEKTFLLDESLHFRSGEREGGESVLAWRDLSGDPGDLYEFVCDPSVPGDKIQTFVIGAVDAQFERKYRKSAHTATEAQLEAFKFDSDDSIPLASSVPDLSESKPSSKETAERMAKDVKSPKKTHDASHHTTSSAPTEAPQSRAAPQAVSEVLTRQSGELHLFDFTSGTFMIQAPSVTAVVSDLGNWKYWLQITSSDGREWLGQEIVADINPVFNFEYLSAIFNHYTEDGSAYSWLLRFRDQATLEEFQEGIMQALWEQLNETKWAKVKDQDRDYVIEAFNDLTMDEAPQLEEEDEEEDEEDEAQSQGGQQSEHYDSDESEDDVELGNGDGNVNSQLAVGTKHDRSFVVRGSKIGVFKHNPNRHLEFTTNISKIETPKGRALKPGKVMLHAEDQNMILQDDANPNSLFRMDLEYGKVVDEWKVDDDIPITNFVPNSKFSQQTAEQVFLGHSKNAMFRVDPRVTGNKLVRDNLKQYASNNGFSAAATTDKGYIAMASNKGDVRLFDKLGLNAKTHLPALGEAIIGLDVSADGRWILATCRTYLLLVDALQQDGKNEGKLGFEKAFAKDSKPRPRRLGLTPSHVAQFQHETGVPLSFTPARFNAGPDTQETSIITSTGPFLVTWNLKKVLGGNKDPYHIKRYSAEVMADNFEFGSDKNVILALPNEVDMVSRKSFKKPTRESIAGPAVRLSGGALATPRRGTRQSHLREEIVNSPY